MDREWNSDLRISNRSAATLPPAMIGETGWDVLLALRADDRHELSLEKLASLVSVPGSVLADWLDWLDDRALVSGSISDFDEQPRVVITRAGRELVDNHFLAASSLQGRH
jgi:DNA-binding MarR family transcriptional regulator